MTKSGKNNRLGAAEAGDLRYVFLLFARLCKLLAIIDWRDAHLLLEECAEGRGVGEVEIVGYFLYALVSAGD